KSEVRIERDDLGVPRVVARSEADAVFALGWLHGQERFFQMDLMRRRAAGELSEIVGGSTVEMDKASRFHRFRWRAGRVVAALPSEDRALLAAYTEGVNAGLEALRAKPVEYVMLRTTPAPWREEDTVLVVYNMFLELQDDTGSADVRRAALQRHFSPQVAAFLDPPGTEWDAPIVGGPLLPPGPAPPGVALPGPVAISHATETTEEPVLGSNNWVVAGAHTADGRAWIADDMHLGLQLPNTWYRARLQWEGVDVAGVTLPGGPGVVVGSNRHVAWGFTNSETDNTDLVPLGDRPVERHAERILVKGGAPVDFDVAETVEGPVIAADPSPVVVRWVAHDVEAVNLRLFRMARVRSLEEAMQVAATSGIPSQNLVVADTAGHIGWTICGRIPRRVAGEPGWREYLPPDAYPRVIDPPAGRIWTANNRVVDGEMLAALGDGGYALGARAMQIRDDLMALDKATPRDLLQVQLDDRALFYTRWRDLVLALLTPESVAGKPLRAEARTLVERWGGRAAVDSVGFRIVRGFRSTVSRDVWNALTASCKDEPGFTGPALQFEGPLWQLVEARAPSANAFLLGALDRTLADLTKEGTPLAQATWGKRNAVRVGHPLAQGMPSLARWLDMPELELPGADHMPRVQSPSFGASQRMVVSPGQEEKSLFHMPGGQSGHPSSPHYGDGHLAWAKGEPTPFLPGPAVDVLVLTPGDRHK
ncbi:MAG TPA: penicillin acylase family protein, partial [Candidatus Polarisedimenticolaceae bacterium]|nr:penicillin acylase family protein [Candidatus Polarisedimenticolaceae bacterium]